MQVLLKHISMIKKFISIPFEQIIDSKNYWKPLSQPLSAKLVSLDFSNFNTSNFIFGLEKGTLYTLIENCTIEYINLYN